MREIVIDISQNNVSCPPLFGGYEGEHKNTKLSIVLPPELLPDNIDQVVQYKFLFQTPIGELIPSPYISTEEITDNTISTILWGQLLKHRGILTGCVVAVADSGTEIELIAKTPSFKLKISDSPTGVDIITDTTENRDFISEILAETKKYVVSAEEAAQSAAKSAEQTAEKLNNLSAADIAYGDPTTVKDTLDTLLPDVSQLKETIGSIDTTLDSIISAQETLIGGGSNE